MTKDAHFGRVRASIEIARALGYNVPNPDLWARRDSISSLASMAMCMVLNLKTSHTNLGEMEAILRGDTKCSDERLERLDGVVSRLHLLAVDVHDFAPRGIVEQQYQQLAVRLLQACQPLDAVLLSPESIRLQFSQGHKEVAAQPAELTTNDSTRDTSAIGV